MFNWGIRHQETNGGVAKPAARARQRGHDGAYRHHHDAGDFFVGQPFQFAQDQNLPKPKGQFAQDHLARAYAAAGRRAEAVQLPDDLKKRSNAAYSNAPEIAVVCAALGDSDQAMTWLEKGFAERFNPGVLLRPGFDSLRADARFRDLERRVGISR